MLWNKTMVLHVALARYYWRQKGMASQPRGPTASQWLQLHHSTVQFVPTVSQASSASETSGKGFQLSMDPMVHLEVLLQVFHYQPYNKNLDLVMGL